MKANRKPSERQRERAISIEPREEMVRIRRRLRSYLWRQRQNGHNRFNELRRRGVPTFHAAVAAGSLTGFWRMSGTRRSNRLCATTTSIGSVSLDFMSLAKLNPAEPPWYVTRMPGGVGGGAPRGVPQARSLFPK
jgi:hypothetical protein